MSSNVSPVLAPEPSSGNVTIDDPNVYTQPWTVFMPLTRDPSYVMFEYACHEGNHAVENILRGGRVEDRAAAASSR